MLRAGLISIIYRKTGSLSLKDIDPAASMTLMSADIERIVQGFQTMHEIWGNAIEVGVAIYLLEQQLGVACVVPVAVSISMINYLAPCILVTWLADYASSFPPWVYLCHELHHVPPSDVARGY